MKLTSLKRCSPLLALLLLTSCYKATFYQNPNAVAGAQHERWSAFFILGLVGSSHFDVRDFCGQGAVAEVQTGGNFATGLVSALTIGIYTPRKVYITCAAKPGQALSDRGRLELLVDSQGQPARATVSRRGREALGMIEPKGEHTFRVSYKEAAL